ncbi:MAG: ParA family protein [Thermofilum sp.]
MSGKSITFISVKGGVGKTTISVNVAEELAERVSGSDKVLVLDLDAQAGSSLYILGDDRLRQLEGKTLYHLMRAKLGGTRVNASEYVVQAGGSWSSRLYVLPGSARILEIEQELLARRGVWLLELRSVIEELKREGFRYIFIDPPASFTLLSRAAIAACDYFLIPVIPDKLGLNALEFLKSDVFNNTIFELAQARDTLGSHIELPICGGIFFNKVEPGTKGTFHEEMIERIKREVGKHRLYGKIPIPVYSSRLHNYIAYPKALSNHVPVKKLKDDARKQAAEELAKFYEEFHEYVINDRARGLDDSRLRR